MKKPAPALLLTALIAACAGGGTQATPPSVPPAAHVPSGSSLSGIRVSGNQLVDGYGRVINLQGVNRSGTEYACVQGWGIFDGPNDDKSVKAMASWHVNAVRVLLNEDCWLNINGIDGQYAGKNYINAIVNYVNLLHQNASFWRRGAKRRSAGNAS